MKRVKKELYGEVLSERPVDDRLSGHTREGYWSDWEASDTLSEANENSKKMGKRCGRLCTQGRALMAMGEQCFSMGPSSLSSGMGHALGLASCPSTDATPPEAQGLQGAPLNDPITLKAAHPPGSSDAMDSVPPNRLEASP